MADLLNWLSGIFCTLLSLASILYLSYYTFKNGFKIFNIVGLFMLFCVFSYLISVPSRIPEFGSNIVNVLTSIAKGDTGG